MFDDDEESTPTPTPIGVAKTIDRSTDDGEMQRLRFRLEEKDNLIKERDQQLKDQAASLNDMETSFAELQNLLPADGNPVKHTRNVSGLDDADAKQLRALLREKQNVYTRRGWTIY